MLLRCSRGQPPNNSMTMRFAYGFCQNSEREQGSIV